MEIDANFKFKMIPLQPNMRDYAYQIQRQNAAYPGYIGYLRGDFGTGGNQFFTTWFDVNRELKTHKFRREFDDLVNSLRFGAKETRIFGSLSEMQEFCHTHTGSAFQGNYTTEYGFKIDTEDNSFILRVNPNKGDYNFYCYCYQKSALDKALSENPQT